MNLTLTPEDQKTLRASFTGTMQPSENDFRAFVRMCERTGLDPLTRQIYLQNRDGQWRSETSIDGLRLIASRTGEYEGQVGPWWCGPDGAWLDVWLTKEPPTAARVGVYRKNFREPAYGVARFDAFAGRKRDGELNTFWKKMGDLMLSKVAEALALRKAFPNEMSGLYTSDEMDQSGSTETEPVDVVNTNRIPTVRPPLPPAEKARAFAAPIVASAPPPPDSDLYKRVVAIREEANRHGANLVEIPRGHLDSVYSAWIERRSAENPLVKAAAEVVK